MASLQIVDHTGSEVGKYDIDPDVLAPKINKQLLHDVVVMYQSNLRLGTAKTKSLEITGNLDFDPLDVAAGSVVVKIDAASIHTGVEKRDLHLKSPDFLDVEKYPTISFRSTRIELDGLDRGLGARRP